MQAKATFAITAWEPGPDEAPRDGLSFGRALVRKTFIGDLEGVSSADLLMVSHGDDGLAYTAIERIEGTLHGRSGTFVVLHGAAEPAADAAGSIVAGSGGGELNGIRGTTMIAHDHDGARMSFDYELE